MEINFCLYTERNKRILFFPRKILITKKVTLGGDFYKELPYGIETGSMDHRIIDSVSYR